MKQEFPTVNVLLSTFEPGDFLSEQLDSLNNQDCSYQLYIRDDASLNVPDFSVIDSKKIKNLDLGQINIGPKNSFFKLLQYESDSDFVAFCDQDDIWLSNKLTLAVELIGDTEVPTLYYSNAFLFEESNISVHTNYQSCSFQRSIFENNAMGCTIVINRSAADLIKRYRGNHAIMHDWVVLLIVTLHGRIIFDPSATLLYRVHSNQTVGYRRKRTVRQIFNLENIEKCVAQINELVDFYPDTLHPGEYHKLLQVLSLRKRKPHLCYLKLCIYPARFRRHISHEIVIRMKFIFLAILSKRLVA